MRRESKAPASGTAVPAYGDARRRHRGVYLAASIASLLVFTVSATPASADRVYESQLSGFSNANGIAIDGADNVWIDDQGSGGHISGYTSGGGVLLGTQTGGGHYGGNIQSIAIDAVSNRLYVADSGPVVLDLFESPLGNFFESWPTENSCGRLWVAVDNSSTASQGSVYVGRSCTGPQQVQALKPNHEAADFSGSASYISANHITGTPSGAIGEVADIATDSDGNFYVVDRSNRVVDEFDSTGVFVRAFDGTGSPTPFGTNLTGVAIDPTNGNVLVVDQSNKVVDEFESGGGYLDQITGAGPSQETPFTTLGGGIAVDSSGTVYVADGTNVDIYTANVVLPKISYSPVAEATHTSGRVSATIDPNEGGEVLSCTFEYGPTPAYDGTMPCSPGPGYSTTTEVHAQLSGLTAETRYHYRVVVSNSNGTRKGPDQTFTPKAVYDLTTGAPSEPVPGSARLNASYTADGNDTKYYFEYVDYAHYEPNESDPYEAGGKTAAPPGDDAGTKNGQQTISAIATGLEPYIPYHYRVVATNSFGTTYGSDKEFFSPPPNLPLIESTFPSEVTQTEAMLNARVNPGFGPTIVRFEYGPTLVYGSHTVATESIGSDGSDHLVSVPVTELEPGGTYHFRALATNFSGTTHGPDQILTMQAVATTPIAALPPAVVPAPAAEPSPGLPHCGALELRAQRAKRQAGRLRQRASSAKGSHAGALRRRAAKFASEAKRLSKSAKACSQSGGGR